MFLSAVLQFDRIYLKFPAKKFQHFDLPRTFDFHEKKKKKKQDEDQKTLLFRTLQMFVTT